MSDELPLEIAKVRKDGWVFRKPYRPGYDFDDEHLHPKIGPGLFPSSSTEDVAKLGRGVDLVHDAWVASRRLAPAPLRFHPRSSSSRLPARFINTQLTARTLLPPPLVSLNSLARLARARQLSERGRLKYETPAAVAAAATPAAAFLR